MAVQHVTLLISSVPWDSPANKVDVIFSTPLFTCDPPEAVPFAQDYDFPLKRRTFD